MNLLMLFFFFCNCFLLLKGKFLLLGLRTLVVLWGGYLLSDGQVFNSLSTLGVLHQGSALKAMWSGSRIQVEIGSRKFLFFNSDIALWSRKKFL